MIRTSGAALLRHTGWVTIHSSHPFLPPEGDRDPLRRLRGRLVSPVTVWTAHSGGRSAAWTVSSLMIADGDPAEVVGLIDEDSDLWDVAQEGRRVAVSVLGWQHRMVAEVCAGQAPSPGGPFRTGEWTDTDWGPVLQDAPGWLGATLLEDEPDHAGWAVLARARIERIELDTIGDDGLLTHLRGRYHRLGDA